MAWEPLGEPQARFIFSETNEVKGLQHPDRKSSPVGLWIKLKPLQGTLQLKRFEELLSGLFGVVSVSPKMVEGGRAVKLIGDDHEPNDGHPILEFSKLAFVVYLNWSDTRFGHVYYLAQAIVDDNELEGHCYDGYHHKDNQAVLAFFKFAGLEDRHQDPQSILSVLQGEFLGKALRHSITVHGQLEIHLGTSILACDEDDWTGPELEASEWDSVSVDWKGRVRFLSGEKENASLQACNDEWTLVDLAGQRILWGFQRGGVIHCTTS